MYISLYERRIRYMNYIQKKLDDWLKENKGLSLEETKSLSEKERKALFREYSAEKDKERHIFLLQNTEIPDLDLDNVERQSETSPILVMKGDR